MKRKILGRNVAWAGMWLALASGMTVGMSAAEAERPNVVLIMADDLGLPALSCTGGIYPTPHLDALAREGVRFEHTFSAALCGPTRATLLTGRYPFRTGMKNNNAGALVTPEKDGCVALRMKEAGYATAVVGKWRQLDYFATQADAAKWGFDEFLIWGAGTPDEDEDEKKGRKSATGKKAQPARGDRYWTPDYNLNGKMLDEAKGKYGPDVLNEHAIDFIRRHQGRPFFLYYPTPLIHGPILSTPDSKDQSKKGRGGAAKKTLASVPGVDSLYADNIAYLDKQVGQIVAELGRLKLREKTLIIFIGDNGSVPVGTVQGRTIDGKKGSMLEGGARVPGIFSWKGTTPAGGVVKDLIDFTDFLPTFCELAGVAPVRKGETRVVDGRSFAAPLRGQKGEPRDWVYVQLNENRYVRSPRWKLTGDGEFFDMKDAPWAQVSVPMEGASGEAKAAREKLQAALDGLRESGADAAGAPVKKNRKKK